MFKKSLTRLTKAIIIVVMIFISYQVIQYSAGNIRINKEKVNFEDENSKIAEEWLKTGETLKENLWIKDALKAYENGLKVAKDNEMKEKLYLKMASVYKTKKDNKNAEKYYKKAIRINPKSVYPYIYILSLYSSIGEKEKGDEIYLKIKEKLDNGEISEDRNIGYVGININYSEFWRGKENAQKALEYLHLALPYVDEEVKKKGYHINLYITLGRKYIMLPNYNKAIKYSKLVLKERPNDPRALNLMGFSYDFLGEDEKALKYYKKALKYGNPHAKKNIKKLKEEMQKSEEKDIRDTINLKNNSIKIGNPMVEE